MESKKWISPKKYCETSSRRRASSKYRPRDDAYAYERSQEGRRLEERIMAILTDKKRAEVIADFIYHMPNGPEDFEGKDFTVVLHDSSPISFGVTCSFNSYKRYFQNHPGQECLWISSQNDEEIWQMIKNLCLRLQTPS